MKSFPLITGFLFGIIPQSSAAITRLTRPIENLNVAFHGGQGNSPGQVIWSSSFTKMQETIEEGKRLASLPPPDMLKSPLSAKDGKSLQDSLGPSESELVQGPNQHNQHLDVESEQYKMMKLARARILKGGGGHGGGGHGGGRGGGGRGSSGGHDDASWNPHVITSTARGGGSHSGVAGTTFSMKLTWVFLAGNLAYLRRLFNNARF